MVKTTQNRLHASIAIVANLIRSKTYRIIIITFALLSVITFIIIFGYSIVLSDSEEELTMTEIAIERKQRDLLKNSLDEKSNAIKHEIERLHQEALRLKAEIAEIGSGNMTIVCFIVSITVFFITFILRIVSWLPGLSIVAKWFAIFNIVLLCCLLYWFWWTIYLHRLCV